MKFPSITALIAHGGCGPARAALAAGLMLSSSCMSLIGSKHTYTASSSKVVVNNAAIRMQVRPEGTDGGSYAFSAMVVGAAVATFDGPFRWRLEATGRAGSHESLVVHRVHTRTGTTRRDEWYPPRHLGKRVEFRDVRKEPGVTRAVYEIPGLLVVKPREDGPLEITVDLTIRADSRSERRQVRFRMDPSKQRQDEFIFLPAEIAKGITTPPGEFEQAGWE
jgi:hypothetical protein